MGDVMPYIFCLGADGKAARTGQADRAFHPDEIRKQPELKIGQSADQQPDVTLAR